MKTANMMNTIKKVFGIILFLIFNLGVAATFRSPSLGGATGLISTPSARTAYESSQFGLDLGTHFIADNGGAFLPKATVSLFSRWEIGATLDTNGDSSGSNEDYLFHTKLRFSPWSGSSNSALAVGGNYQALNGPNNSNGQFYLAATYGGQFFNMAAETSLVFGKTFGDNTRGGDIDFSMGFELDFFPSLFQGYLHWLVDFANYQYSMHGLGAHSSRGIFNTGVRIDVLKAVSGMSLKLDVTITDALDDDRDFMAGAIFGIAF